MDNSLFIFGESLLTADKSSFFFGGLSNSCVEILNIAQDINFRV